MALENSAALISAALGHADLIERVERGTVSGSRAFQEIEQVLVYAQIGEVGRGDDQDVVGADAARA